MINFKEQIAEAETSISRYLGLPFHDFLFSIENVFQINKEICAFSGEYSNFMQNEIDFIVEKEQGINISVFYNPFVIRALDKSGNRDYNVNSKAFDMIGQPFYRYGRLIQNYKANDLRFFYIYKDFIEGIFKDFEKITEREDRFSVYEKHLKMRMPDSEQIINKWQSGDVSHVLSSEECKLLRNEDINLNDFERQKNKNIFLINYFLLKEMLIDHECISEFQLIMHLFPFNGLEIENAAIIYQGNPEREEFQEIEEKVKKLAHCKYPLEVANFAGQSHFAVNRTTTIKDSPLINYMDIKESEANEIITEMEKYLILKKVNKNNKDETLSKKKRL